MKIQKEKLLKFISEIKKIRGYYEKNNEKDRFNIFYALHKEHDEVNLHSRFISYLLAKNSGHRKGSLFAELFFKTVLKKDSSFLVNYEVIPNEFSKTEFKEIDILLFDNVQEHAIIIENKIFAKDSNHTNKEKGYNGQLERYYNTILKGVPVDNGENTAIKELKKHNYIAKTIDVFYLTLNSPNQESFIESKGETLKNVKVTELYYKDEIIKWLEKCIERIKQDDFLKKIINQYLILVRNMTNTNIPIPEINELRDVYVKDLKTTQYLIDNFKNIKWHTLNDFFLELYSAVNKKFKNVKFYPENDEDRAKLITKITHDNKDENVGITFETKDGKLLYISAQNNLSWGLINKKWTDFKNDQVESIRFSDFSTDNTFNLIDKNHTKTVINTIINEILEEKEDSFKNLKVV